MAPRLTDNAVVVQVRQFWTAATAQGPKALVIETQEAGTIAFAVNSRDAIEELRRCIDQLEQAIP